MNPIHILYPYFLLILQQDVLKGYQTFTQVCGNLRLVTPRDAFLASLCRFTLPYNTRIVLDSSGVRASVDGRPGTPGTPVVPNSPGSVIVESGSGATNVTLSFKNVQAMRTLFSIAHSMGEILDTGRKKFGIT